jgi:hypothetical protein
MTLDPSNQLRTFFYEGLSGLNYEKDFAVYSGVPENPVDYVHMRELTITDDGTKDQFIWDCTLTIDIISGFKAKGSWKKCDAVSSQVWDKLLKKDIKTDNFSSCTDPFVESVNNFTDVFDDYKILGKTIILRFKVQQVKF